MTKKDLVPFKHILVSRDRGVYWYVGENFDNGNNSFKKIEYICLSPNISINNSNDYLKENLLANRNGYWERACEEPRKYDIIYIYEILNNYYWLDYIRKHEYIKGNLKKYINNYYGECKNVVKLIWERIDIEFEEYR